MERRLRYHRGGNSKKQLPPEGRGKTRKRLELLKLRCSVSRRGPAKPILRGAEAKAGAVSGLEERSDGMGPQPVRLCMSPQTAQSKKTHSPN